MRQITKNRISSKMTKSDIFALLSENQAQKRSMYMNSQLSVIVMAHTKPILPLSEQVYLRPCRSADVTFTVSILYCRSVSTRLLVLLLTQLSVCLSSSAQKHCTHCFLDAPCDSDSEGWLETSQPNNDGKSDSFLRIGSFEQLDSETDSVILGAVKCCF